MINEQEFKNHFIITFLAAWCAENYADACAFRQHERLSHPPVEDAISLADSAWDHYAKLIATAD